MKTSTNVKLALTIPKEYRNQLNMMAAERILANPEEEHSAASMASELLVMVLRSKHGSCPDSVHPENADGAPATIHETHEVGNNVFGPQNPALNDFCSED